MVGAGWGRVHIRALRRQGVDVVAVCGSPRDGARTRTAAADEGVPLALDDLGEAFASSLTW